MRMTHVFCPAVAAAPPRSGAGLDPVGLACSPVRGPKADGKITQAGVGPLAPFVDAYRHELKGRG